MVSRYCTTVVKYLNWGSHADSPRRIVHDLRGFNARLKPRDIQDLEVNLWDIQDFFPNVCRELSLFDLAMSREELWRRNPMLVWF